MITGGLRDAADFAKALALGADAVAIANTAIQAIGCLGMRACHTNNCPVGIATQKPHLRARLPVDEASQRLDRFLARPSSSCRCSPARAATTTCRRVLASTTSRRSTATWPRLTGIAYGGVTCRVTHEDPTVATTRAGRSRRPLVWHKVAELDELPDGRVKTVTVGRHSPRAHALGDRYGALDNHCPHQGGPLGEGSIEKGLLRCPWHGYDYDPLTGTPPPGFTDAPACFPVEVRADGIYVALPPDATPSAHRLRRDGRDDGRVGRHARVRHGRPLQPRLRRRDARRAEQRGDLTFIGIRHEGAAAFAASAYGKLTGRLAACFAIAGPDRPTCSPASTTPRSTARRCSRSPGRCRRRCSAAARSRTSTSPPRSPTSPVLAQTVLRESDHAELMTLALQARDSSSAASRTSCCPTRCRCCRSATARTGVVTESAGSATTAIAPAAAALDERAAPDRGRASGR